VVEVVLVLVLLEMVVLVVEVLIHPLVVRLEMVIHLRQILHKVMMVVLAIK
jgi:hypothetical protein